MNPQAKTLKSSFKRASNLSVARGSLLLITPDKNAPPPLLSTTFRCFPQIQVDYPRPANFDVDKRLANTIDLKDKCRQRENTLSDRPGACRILIYDRENIFSSAFV